jgi:oligopeptide/dipeptide ABC transporter ATP-binding protein
MHSVSRVEEPAARGAQAADAARGQAVLRIQDLSVVYGHGENAVPAVRGVSLEVAQGETVGIVGESGSGKSTLALAVMRLLAPGGQITEGSIHFGDLDLTRMPLNRLADVRGRQVAMVFQDSMSSLNPLLSAGSQITEVLRHHRHMSRRDADDHAAELLAEVGVTDVRRRLGQLPHQLSGGIRQRVALAIALAADPDVLIADEPTTALDVTIQAQLLDLIKREQQTRGMAILLITHDHGVVARVCDRVAVMYAGRIVEIGDAHDLFGDPRHPYTLGLQRSVPRLDVVAGQRLPSIPGAPPAMQDLPSGCPFHPRCTFKVEVCEQTDPPLERALDAGPGHLKACWVDVHAGARVS